jgi:hypothetical protein
MQTQEQTAHVPFPGQWSTFRGAGQCPACGAWVKVGRDGKTMKPVGKNRVRYLYCKACGESFKATETDETFIF